MRDNAKIEKEIEDMEKDAKAFLIKNTNKGTRAREIADKFIQKKKAYDLVDSLDESFESFLIQVDDNSDELRDMTDSEVKEGVQDYLDNTFNENNVMYLSFFDKNGNWK